MMTMLMIITIVVIVAVLSMCNHSYASTHVVQTMVACSNAQSHTRVGAT